MEGGFDGILPRTPTALIIMALTHATPGAPCDVRPLGPRLGASLSVALFKSRQLEVIRLVLPAGKTMPPHSVHGEITLQCIEGLLQVELRAGVQVPPNPDADDPRLVNVRAGADLFAALRSAFPNEAVLYFGEAMLRRRLGDPVSGSRDGAAQQPLDHVARARAPDGISPAARHGRVGARVPGRLQADGAGAIHRCVLRKRELAGGRAALRSS